LASLLAINCSQVATADPSQKQADPMNGNCLVPLLHWHKIEFRRRVLPEA